MSPAELEALLAAQPEDAATWAVYGDWLLSRGEPWGAAIVAACAGARTPHAQHELDARWKAELEPLAIKWSLGAVATLGLSWSSDASRLEKLRAMLRHPACRLVRSIGIGVGQDAAPVDAYAQWVLAVADAGPFPLLDRAHIGGWTQWTIVVGGLARLRAAAPRLRELGLQRAIEASDAAMAAIRRLEAEPSFASHAGAPFAKMMIALFPAWFDFALGTFSIAAVTEPRDALRLRVRAPSGDCVVVHASDSRVMWCELQHDGEVERAEIEMHYSASEESLHRARGVLAQAMHRAFRRPLHPARVANPR